MIGRVLDLVTGRNGKQRLTIELDGDFSTTFDALKGVDRLDVDIKKHREKRSKNANAYFHLLIGKIAEARGLGLEEVKTMMVTEYGTLARDEEGRYEGVKIPSYINASKYYRYIKLFDTRIENNIEYNCYLLFKPTSDMDTKEMCRLIDGTSPKPGNSASRPTPRNSWKNTNHTGVKPRKENNYGRKINRYLR